MLWWWRATLRGVQHRRQRENVYMARGNNVKVCLCGKQSMQLSLSLVRDHRFYGPPLMFNEGILRALDSFKESVDGR